MNSFGGGCVACLLLFVLWAGTVYPATDAPAWAAAVVEKQVSDLSGNLDRANSGPSAKCCDIAFMETFRINQLSYARTLEFVEAVRRVASGESTYSPSAGVDIPFAAWKDFAMEMRRHFSVDTSQAVGSHPSGASAHVHVRQSNLALVTDRKSMIPALIYLASLEYRMRTGQAGITPIFPHLFRAAAEELNGRLTEKRRLAEAYSKRAAAIVARIAEAERTGAGKLSPVELARAKAELERARRHASEVRTSLLETDTAFARAESLADGLLKR